MGFRDLFVPTVNTAAPVSTADVAASLAPVNTTDSLNSYWVSAGTKATREEAMSIPTVARGRGIICSSIASIGIEIWERASGDEVEDIPRVFRTPDPRVNGAATYVWTAEDLLFHGYAYWQITELYKDTMRVRSVQRIAPDRVTINTNALGTEITSYMVDGSYVPNTGVGSLVVFYGNDEGLLNRAGRTIRTGAELEKAAANYAREPIPSMVLKSNGTTLPADRIRALLDAWGASRRNRRTFSLWGRRL